LDVEEAALSQIHMAVTKQITRLEVEENMLKLLMSKLEREAGGTVPQEAASAEPACVAAQIGRKRRRAPPAGQGPDNLEKIEDDDNEIGEEAGPTVGRKTRSRRPQAGHGGNTTGGLVEGKALASAGPKAKPSINSKGLEKIHRGIVPSNSKNKKKKAKSKR